MVQPGEALRSMQRVLANALIGLQFRGDGELDRLGWSLLSSGRMDAEVFLFTLDRVRGVSLYEFGERRRIVRTMPLATT